MAYFELAALQALIPGPDLTKALDDNADGVIDAFTVVEAQASGMCDALLSVRYATPFADPVPPIVPQAAKIFAAELCYKRRGIADDANPWHEVATSMRAKLGRIATGDEPLAPEIARELPSVSVIKECAPTHSTYGGRIA